MNHRAEVLATTRVAQQGGPVAEAARQSMNRLHRAQYEVLRAKFPTSRPSNPTEAAIQLGEQRVLAELLESFVQ
jgi:hypothetical protein